MTTPNDPGPSLASLFYIGRLPLPDPFCQAKGMGIMTFDTPEAAVLYGKRPDLVIFAPGDGDSEECLQMAGQWLRTFRKERFRFIPPIFLAIGQRLSNETTLDLLTAGFDHILPWPPLPEEVLIRARPFMAMTLSAQQQAADRAALARAFTYLDRFKEELAAVKADLTGEKQSLNAALRQIQKMTEERRRLKQAATDLKHRLAQNMDGFSKILSTLIRTRVERNRGHGEQVARAARFLGQEMGLDENQLEDLTKAAMLHEIGLLFLSGPADKTDREHKDQPDDYDQIMKTQYPVKGAELLAACPGFEKAALIIRSLNEWADGTGYPEGLKRPYIPMGSRILAGADELQNLWGDPKFASPSALVAGLEDLASTRLDPTVVRLLGKYVITLMHPEARVRGVGIEQLEPGMVLGAPLFTAAGTKLFSAETELTREAIGKIIQYSREHPVDGTVYIKV